LYPAISFCHKLSHLTCYRRVGVFVCPIKPPFT
jgi:hypothetical protein